MNIDALNFTLTQLKSVGIQAFDNLNKVKTTAPLSGLVFSKSTEDDKVLLQDALSKSGIIMQKFSLQSLFPSVIDIRRYKKGMLINQPKIDGVTAEELNNRHSTKLTVGDPDVINTASSFDPAAIRDFLTFCRVFGFFDLTLRDVHLNVMDNKLIISVNSTHDFFTGYVEVLV